MHHRSHWMAKIILPLATLSLCLWRGLRPSGQGLLLPLKATRGWVLSPGITGLKCGQTALQRAATDPVGTLGPTWATQSLCCG